MGDLTPPQQQQLTTFLQQLQALKTPRSVALCMLVRERESNREYVCWCEIEKEEGKKSGYK